MSILSGIVLLSLGTVGEYVVRTYEETRDRPLYIVDRIDEADTLPRKLLRRRNHSEQPTPGARPGVCDPLSGRSGIHIA